MFRFVFVLCCFAHQWTFLSGYRTDRLASIHALEKSVQSSDEEVESNCVKKDSCTCVRKDGTGINLHKLDTAPKPRFSIKSDYQYIQWNPCTGYTIDKDNDVAVSYGFIAAEQIVFGHQKYSSFIKYHDVDALIYKADNMSSRIYLYCEEDTTPTFKFISVTNDLLEGAYQGPCTFEKTEEKSISTGSIILITFFVVLIIYFVLGWVINVYVRKAEGYEKIPNYSFWSSLPTFIKDGCIYTCRGKSAKSAYVSI